MKTKQTKTGFSLIEVNMAIFIVAVGIMSMVVLYPLGLRESTQGAADLKQAMFADDVLNQIVALASQTNITWTSWKNMHKVDDFPNIVDGSDQYLPNLQTTEGASVFSNLKIPGNWENMDGLYKVACCLVPGASDKIMGVMVQSSDLVKTVSKYSQFSNNPTYYAEVMFQGDPTK